MQPACDDQLAAQLRQPRGNFIKHIAQRRSGSLQIEAKLADAGPLPSNAEKLNANCHACIVIERSLVVRESVWSSLFKYVAYS